MALWQAYYVEERLRRSGVDTEIVTIETKGDKILDVTIAKIGSKGVFTEEIEEQLADGRIDIAVHSAKDMQSTLPEGFELVAFAEREKPNDIVLSRDNSINLNSGSFLLGTASTRRVATLKHYYPSIETIPIRGNLQTRIRKMDEGQCDALLLAYAGVHRMGYDDLIVQQTSITEFTPAVGQGSVAIEVHESLEKSKIEVIRSAINHPETEICIKAERAFLKEMDGGCSIPVFGHAKLTADRLEITGGIISLDGQNRISRSVSGNQTEATRLGIELGKAILGLGGKEILEEIKRKNNE